MLTAGNIFKTLNVSYHGFTVASPQNLPYSLQRFIWINYREFFKEGRGQWWSNRCSSVQKSDVNFGSQSLTTVSGSPWRRTTFVMNNGASWAAIVVVVNGIRCTSDVSLHSTTQI